ncbi:MAG: dephospho-CoA kinase [Planctomycetota bacterium]
MSDLTKKPCANLKSSLKLTTLGLTGGVASGKSTVARMFKKLGAAVIDADRIAREVIELPRVKNKLIRYYGTSILGKNGLVNRKTLAGLAFSHKRDLNKLNRISHPVILKLIKKHLGAIKKIRAGSQPIAILDAALLMESRLSGICDFLIFIERGLRKRNQAAQKIREWLPGEINRRERFQYSLKLKKKKSDFIIKNNRSLLKTWAQVKNIFKQIKTGG